MSVLVVGGDKLGNIKENLRTNGFNRIEHITGRRNSDRRLKIPDNMDLVVILTDFINHKVAEIVKAKSKKQNVKVLFSKRSWVYMEDIIKDFVESQEHYTNDIRKKCKV